MLTKKDIETRADIEKFLLLFYKSVLHDPTIGIIFTTIFPLNMEKHIPVITDFWETILLDHHVYKKNAMQVHYHINKEYPLQKMHFDAWLHLFNTTLDELFAGEKTLLAKKRALGIAQLMQLKMNEINLHNK